MSSAPTFVHDAAMVTAVAAVTGLVARRLGQASILGYLVAGLLVGPYLSFPMFADPHRVEAMAEFGVVLVMFAVGLELRLAKLARILPVAGLTALVQMGCLLWAGFTLGRAFGWDTVASAFLGTSVAISSTMVVTEVFAQRPVEAGVRDHVLGVLVLQDLAAIALIAAMTALAAGQDLAPWPLLLTVARLVGVLVVLLAAGLLVVPRLVRVVVAQGDADGVTVLAVGLAFAFAVLAATFGYSVALGAFVAGIVVAESGRSHELEQAVAPLRAVFAAIFFVSVGMTVDPSLALGSLPQALAVTALVILTHLVSVTLASVLSGASLHKAVLSGLSLGQVGEFSFILATIGASAGVLPPAFRPILVTVATLTAFTTPLLLARGDALVTRIDHLLPARVQRLLLLDAAWMDRVRGAPLPDRADMGRKIRAIAADVVALLVIIAVGLATRDELVAVLVERTAVSAAGALAAVGLATLVLSLPFWLGLGRNTLRLASAIGRTVAERAPSPQIEALVRALVYLGIVLAVGLPALGLLRPLVPVPGVEALLLVALGLSVAWVRHKLGQVDGEIRSGAERVAAAWAAQSRRGARIDEAPVAPVALAPMVQLTLPERAPAVGHTLAELNLRARTGVTVLAIHTAAGDVVLPSGQERLTAGDVLAISGSTEAIEEARLVLLGEAPIDASRNTATKAEPRKCG